MKLSEPDFGLDGAETRWESENNGTVQAWLEETHKKTVLRTSKTENKTERCWDV